MKWIKQNREFDRFELDETFIKKNFFSSQRIRIVKYPGETIPDVFYHKIYKVYDRYEENFNLKYPFFAKLSKFFILKERYEELKMDKETFEKKFNIKL